MPNDARPSECPHCRRTNLVEGSIRARGSHRFAPAGRFMWMGYEVRGFACLECGYVGHRLAPADLEDMKRRLAEAPVSG